MRLTVVFLGLGLVCGGCSQPVTRLNAPPHGTSNRPSELQAEYAHMVDNALLADMSVSDVHFLPGQARLNSLGEEHLRRLARLLELYGGTVRFNTDETDQKLVADRTARIITFLCEAGIDATSEMVSRDLPASAGMDAAQAILIKVNEGTYAPKKKSGNAAGPSQTGASNTAKTD